MRFWTYILCNKPHGTLYVGMTNNIIARGHQHREGIIEGFTKRYGVKRLVYFEEHASALEAIAREKTKLAAGVEDRAHRAAQSTLGRPL